MSCNVMKLYFYLTSGIEMFLLLRLIIFYNLIIWKACSAYYAGEETNDRMKDKILKLATELVLDATSKVASVQHLRYELHKDVAFQYGTIVYEMRYRHRKMYKIYTDVLHAIEEGTGDDEQYLSAIAEVDSLAHEIFNFATMMLIHDANLHLDKTRPGYDLFFRRSDNMSPVWLGLVDSLNNDNINPPESSTPPEDNNQTHTGKRKNGVWHYAVPIN